MARRRKDGNRRWSVLGFSLTEILAVAAIVTSIPSAGYLQAKQKAHQTTCLSNLRSVGQLFMMYHMENGHYPKAAFYPDNPLQGDDSISVILDRKRQKNSARDIWMCPSLPDKLQEKGLGFVYNDSIAGKSRIGNPAKKWVLIEINCVSPDVPAPHPDGYNILFADGRVVSDTRLPKKIVGAKKAMIEKIRHEYQLACACVY